MASGAKICSSSQGPWQILRACFLPHTFAYTQPGKPQTCECTFCAHAQADASLTSKVYFNQEVACVGPTLSPYPSPYWGRDSQPGEGLFPYSYMAVLQGLAQPSLGEDRETTDLFSPLKVVVSLPGNCPKHYAPERW